MKLLREWYALERDAQTGIAQLSIYDEIGEGWFSDGVTAKQWLDEMKALEPEEPIDVRINSPGGLTTDAKAMYNLLKRHKGDIRVFIDGLAASAASYVAMAGDTVTMAENAMIMIHDPWGFTMGNAADHRAQAEVLEKEAGALAQAYVLKSGMETDEVLQIMAAESWFDAEAAVNSGFADQTDAPVKLAASYQLDRYPFKRVPHLFHAAMTSQPREVPAMPEPTPSSPAPQAATEIQGHPSTPSEFDDLPYSPQNSAGDEENVVDMDMIRARSEEIAQIMAIARINDPSFQHELTMNTALSMQEVRDAIQARRAEEDEKIHVDNHPAPPGDTIMVAQAKKRAAEDVQNRANQPGRGGQ